MLETQVRDLAFIDCFATIGTSSRVRPMDKRMRVKDQAIEAVKSQLNLGMKELMDKLKRRTEAHFTEFLNGEARGRLNRV